MDADKKKNPGWTEERVEILTRLWSEGLSASAIAKVLGGVTRNAVIGKIHRLRADGLAPARRAPGKDADTRITKTKPASTTASSSPRTSGAVALKPDVEKQSTPSPVEKPAARVRLVEPPIKGAITNIMELTRHTCRWPIGDPGDEDFAYCGGEAGNGSPYCEHHAKQAYQTASPRRHANG